MNVLVVSSRFPWPPYSGDRMRASIWLDALAPHARVALVAPAGAVPPHAPAIRFFPAAPSFARRLSGAVTILRRGLPLQSLLAAPYAWDHAIAEARRQLGPFDTSVVVLSRSDAWVRPSLGSGTKILDSIDSLRRNAEERERASSLLMRPFWRHEERRLARAEREAGQAYDRVVVVSEDETGEFGGAGMAIANSVPIAPYDASAPRRFDFGFWGRLAYFANADAARLLLHEIVPAIRALHPDATFIIGGSDIPRSIRAAAERGGIELRSPIQDVAAFARDVCVAIVPMRYGSGQSSKLLEAAEAGCAAVTTPEALRGLPRLAPHATVAADAASIASSAVALLHDRARRETMGEALRRTVERHHSRATILSEMAALAGIGRHEAAAVSA
ncbi:MAG TPA: glycosyltransferase [Thermoanaerobaculia bacterium]|nr:glycosyltransferase [Thermoanaerobaculia bacterium]